MILAIDPGSTQSAYVLVEDDLSRVVEKGKIDNGTLFNLLMIDHFKADYVAIEGIASYGMPVGAEVFTTCYWIGVFGAAAWNNLSTTEKNLKEKPVLIFRKDEKMHICQSMRAKDANIRRALIDRFGEVGTKKNPGYFYGFKSDIWSAMAVATVFHDKYLKGVK